MYEGGSVPHTMRSTRVRVSGVLFKFFAASSAQRDKATVILHSPLLLPPCTLPRPLLSSPSSFYPFFIYLLFPTVSPLRFSSFYPHLAFFSTYFIFSYMMDSTMVARCTS